MNRLSEKIGRIARHDYFLLALIVLLAFSLRIYNLKSEPLIGDEIMSLGIVRHYQADVAGMIEYLQEVEIHPPLYYILLKAWTAPFGFGVLAVRSLSLIFGLAILPLVYYVGKRLFDSRNVGLLAAFFTAVLPMQIEYSRLARPYMIFCFFGLLNIFFLWQYLGSREKKYLVYFTLTGLIGLYLHYSFMFILATGASYWFCRIIMDRSTLNKEIQRWLLTVGAIFVGFYWWFQYFLYKNMLAGVTILGMKRSFSYFGFKGINIFELIFSDLIWVDRSRQVILPELILIILVKVLFAVLIIKLCVKFGNDIKKNNFFKKVIFLAWLFFLMIIFFILSPQAAGYADINERHIILGSIIFVLILAGLYEYAPRRSLLIFYLIFITSLLSFNMKLVNKKKFYGYDCRFEKIAGVVNENFRENDLVVNYHGYRPMMNYFLRDVIKSVEIYPVRLLDWQNDAYASRDTLGLAENEIQLISDKSDERAKEIKFDYLFSRYKPARIWMVIRDTSDQTLSDWLDNHGWEKNNRSEFGCGLELFVKK